MNTHIYYNHAINHEGMAYLNDSPNEYMHIKRLMTVDEFLLQDKDVCQFMDDALDLLEHSSSSRQLKKLGESAIYPITIAKIIKFRSENWLWKIETSIYKGGKPTLFENFFEASTYSF
ncbi:hypothetical protein [Priestia aryabhattai]|uniref:hypothetical protein n=1 Tax=Priestia aryabhattai TaxID=412384 RepID=UPI001C8D589F|nr:hypothetical protein [Priestia aryabhattai]MBX9986356.1 hypothetical protein [Priestia aryabhattai]MBY0001975.1 hypothetical protein [Priestia aryabhattai]